MLQRKEKNKNTLQKQKQKKKKEKNIDNENNNKTYISSCKEVINKDFSTHATTHNRQTYRVNPVLYFWFIKSSYSRSMSCFSILSAFHGSYVKKKKKKKKKITQQQ